MCVKQVGPTGRDDLSADSTSAGPIRPVTGWLLVRQFPTIDHIMTMTWRSGSQLGVKLYFQSAEADTNDAGSWTVVANSEVTAVGEPSFGSNSLALTGNKMWVRFGTAGYLQSGSTAEEGGVSVMIVGST